MSVWGTTFISTKLLLTYGLTPAQVMFIRFLIAYALIWIASPKKLWAGSLRDEGWLVLAGLCGGSLYFQTENMALGITLTTNVALILCTAPILTALVSRLFFRGSPLGKNLVLGSFIALSGVALVVYNGQFVLKIRPLGDILTFLSALSWAFYTNILKKLDGRYDVVFITRKVFFYGLVTLAPVFLFTPFTVDPAILFRPAVVGNLLFLGLLASLVCFIAWNHVVRRLGPVTANNYIYATPLVTLVASRLILGEPVTVGALAGALLIIGGVFFAQKPVRR